MSELQFSREEIGRMLDTSLFSQKSFDGSSDKVTSDEETVIDDKNCVTIGQILSDVDHNNEML